MAVDSRPQQETILHIHSLEDPAVQLDLSSPLWNLPDGTASSIVGRDVVFPNQLRPERGRRSLGAAIDTDDLPITQAFTGRDVANVTQRYRVTHYRVWQEVNIPTTQQDYAGSGPFSGGSVGVPGSIASLNYDPANGQVSSGGTPFDAPYEHWPESTFVWISPRHAKGIYKIVSFDNATFGFIVIDPGLTAAALVGGEVTGIVAAPTPGVLFISNLDQLSDYDETGFYITKGPFSYAAEGGWEGTLAGGFVVFDSDERNQSEQRVGIKSVSSLFAENDSLLLEGTPTIPRDGQKLEIFPSVASDKRGIWVTNGRKFWLYNRGSYTLYLDLGDNKFKGEKWRMTRIHNNRLMLVNPKYPARIIRLDAPEFETGEKPDDFYVAGCLTPAKPDESFDPDGSVGPEGRSWCMLGVRSSNEASAALPGDLLATAPNEPVNYKVRVRAVNLLDNLESQFVNVFVKDTTIANLASVTTVLDPPYLVPDKTDDDLEFGITDLNAAIAVSACGGEIRSGSDDDDWPPPVHSRWSHIEIWRTLADGNTYQLESRIALSNGTHFTFNENFSATTALTASDNDRGMSHYASGAWGLASLFSHTGKSAPDQFGAFPVSLSDDVVAGFPSLTAQDFNAGLPPPICQDVVQLNGVTFCFGMSDSEPDNPVFYSYNWAGWVCHSRDGDSNVEWRVAATANPWREWFSVNGIGYQAGDFKDGDQVVIEQGGAESLGTQNTGLTLDTGVFDVDEDGTWANDKVPVTSDPGTLSDTGGSGFWPARASVRRPFTFVWPKILSDEDFWYSRTDKFAPESFSDQQVKEISRRGDTFRRAVKVGNYIAVIMDQGVHLIFLDSDNNPQVDTIAESSEGTPWEDSVVVVGNVVVWATQFGPKIMSVSAQPNIEGKRGQISNLGEERFRVWFNEAFKNGERIDTGVDFKNGCIRWRRRIAGLGADAREIGPTDDDTTTGDDDDGTIENPLICQVGPGGGDIPGAGEDEIICREST